MITFLRHPSKVSPSLPALFFHGRKGLLALVSALLFVTAFSDSFAQIVSVRNDYVAAFVNTAQNAGRFWISAGPKKGGQRFLFHGNTSVQMITSNVIFRVERGEGDVEFFCNTTEDFFLRGQRPMFGSDAVRFMPYDTIRISGDTIELEYENIALYRVKLRFIVEEPTTVYDNGADILIEFEYEPAPWASNRSLGIMMMLDGDNGAAMGTISSGDHTSIVTTAGYYNTSKPGYLFRPPYDSIPEFYHVGNFKYNPFYIQRNRILPIHRLRGVSNGGVPLTEPNRFAVGNWRVYRTLAWNPFSVNRVGDVATSVQWENLRGKGIVRTAFGSNNEGRNNIFHCRDKQLFADIRTVRLIEQENEDGPYSPSRFAVEMWVSNTASYGVIHKKIRLVTPILSEPDNTERALLDPSTPRQQEIVLLPTFTKKLTWILDLNPNSADTLIRLQFDFADKDFNTNTYKDFQPFLDACTPLITVKPFRPPPTDTLPPVIEWLGSGRNATAFWNLRTFDRHPRFDYDTGLEEIRVVTNKTFNFRLNRSPDPFRKCDVTETVDLRMEVIDTTQEGHIVVMVRDCNGNVSFDSAQYTPRPDPFAPQVLSRDSTGSWDPVDWPCNARTRIVTVIDSLHQFVNAGDYGLGTIKVVTLNNFKKPTIINKDGISGGPITDFDPRASILLEVIDTMINAEAEILVTDYAGNDTTLYFFYCTIDDFHPPVVTHLQQSATEWEVTATDSAEWDRGLLDAIVISSSNILFRWPDDTLRTVPPDISKGVRFNRLHIEVANHCDSAELIIQYRDIYYESDPPNHGAFDTIRYDGVPDTLHPNILIIPGFDGSSYFYEVRIDDIHIEPFGSEIFECDRGLESIEVNLTSNLRIRQPLSWSSPYEASLSVEVIDTLVIDQIDTLCITATDSAGNISKACDFWPTTPDDKSPLFIGRFDRGRMTITGVASDNRENDRGLGSVTLRSPVNLDSSFSLPNLWRKDTTNVTIDVINPLREISGELVVQDLYGKTLKILDSSLHTVILQFELPVVRLAVEMPELVDAETEFAMQIRTMHPIESELVQSIVFDITMQGPAQFIDAERSPSLNGTFTALPQPTRNYTVRYELVNGEIIPAGRLLGSLRFRALARNTHVVPFTVHVVPGTELTNDGNDRVVSSKKVENDPLSSQLILPPPILLTGGDTLTYVNGDCNRVLTSFGAGKPRGLEILSLDPQPVYNAHREVNAILRDVPEDGAVIEWSTPDGRRLAKQQLDGSETEVTLYHIPLPEGAPKGLYFIRVSSSTGVDTRKILIVQ